MKGTLCQSPCLYGRLVIIASVIPSRAPPFLLTYQI